MRICFVTTGDVVSLATMKRAIGMATPLKNCGHDVSILAWRTPTNEERFAAECPDAEICWLNTTLSASAERKAKINWIREWKPDIVYICAFGVRNSITRFNVPKGTKVIIEHSELSSAIPRPFVSKCRIQFFEALSVLACDCLLCASEYLVNHYNGLKKKLLRFSLPVFYHPYAYDKSILVTDEALTNKIQEEKGDRKLILYMGTLAKNYGIHDILRAVKELSSKRTDFKLHVFGRGRHADEARALASELSILDRVVFDGYVPEQDLGSWFTCADVFLSPIYDTIQDKARCPSKIYMYLPFKKPVVTCKIGDPALALGEDGFYFKSGDVADFAGVISKALDASSTWKPKNDASQHSWESRTNEFLAYMKEVL